MGNQVRVMCMLRVGTPSVIVLDIGGVVQTAPYMGPPDADITLQGDVSLAGTLLRAMLDWAKAEHGLAFTPVVGIIHAPQPPATLAAVEALALTLDDFALAGLAYQRVTAAQ